MNWRAYWLGFSICTPAAVLLVGYFTAASLAGRPPRPDLPRFDQSFPAEYSAAGSSLAHDIFFHGLFNVGERLRAADIFLIGSSHFEFGLSAAEFETLLSKEGHAVHAYNLGLGCGETASFGLEILAKNGVSGGSVIAEAGTLDIPGAWVCGQQAKRHDIVQAYAAVLNAWAKYLYDWAFDPILPRFVIAVDGTHVQRFLYGFLVEREWARGDILFAWHPVEGKFYPDHPMRETEVAAAARARGVDWQISDGQFTVEKPLQQQAAALGVDLTVTLVPFVYPKTIFSDFNLWYQGQVSRIQSTASGDTRCFVAIPAEGLRSWDGGNHLTGKSRALATERLAAGYEARRCQSAPDSLNSPQAGH
jgi:hypothetical protein